MNQWGGFFVSFGAEVKHPFPLTSQGRRGSGGDGKVVIECQKEWSFCSDEGRVGLS